MSNNDPIVICSAARTPIGALQGALSPLSANELGAIAIAEAVKRAGVSHDKIDEAYMGCVLPAGQGQAPARQAVIKAGLPNHIPSTTINKMCGSGLKAVMMGYDSLIAGSNDVVLVGGMESMTNAPYLLDRARSGYRMGHGSIKDHMFLDGLEDAYDKGKLMGVFADQTANDHDLSRKEQDDFAIESLNRAKKATEDGSFANEIVPVEIKTRKGSHMVEIDESPTKAMPEKIPNLKPAFNPEGTVTAANASSISDGAAALILTRKSVAEKMGLSIEAVIHGHASHAHEPSKFCTAPIGSMEKLLNKTGWKIDEIDLFEINEAFAVVTMAAMKEMNIPHEKVNVHGGACALGHPIGATGSRILTSLLYALKKYDLKTGMASLCIGGGEAVAVAIERV